MESPEVEPAELRDAMRWRLREMISDLTEIARASTDGLEAGSDNDYEEVLEYVRIVALSCFAEFARLPGNGNAAKPTLH